MKLNKIIFTILLSCLNIVACNAGNCFRRGYTSLFPRQEQLDRQLFAAAYRGNLPAVKQAIADGADVHAYNDAALHEAIRYGEWKVVRFLLELPGGERANVLALKNYALQEAAEHGELDMIRFLLTALPEGQRADIHADDDGALLVAARSNRWAVAACLLQHGADRTKLSAEQLELLQDSVSAQKYIAAELRTAINNKDILAIEQLLEIIPLQLPEEIEQLVVPVIAELIMQLRRQGFPEAAIGRILSFYIVPTTFGIYARLEEKALEAQGTHETK